MDFAMIQPKRSRYFQIAIKWGTPGKGLNCFQHASLPLL
jgi:hypothetical protein